MSQSRDFWIKIKKGHAKAKKEFIEYLGEEFEDINNEITEGEKEYFNNIKEIVHKVKNLLPEESSEYEYQKGMIQEMLSRSYDVKAEVEDELIDQDGKIKKIRMDICEYREEERIPYELKKRVTRSSIDQIKTYMTHTGSVIGYLIGMDKGEIYMYIKNSEIEFLSYDGTKTYRSCNTILKRYEEVDY